MKKQLDLDRLNATVSTINDDHGIRSRRVGFTTAYIQLLMGEAELGECGNTYLYVGENHNHALYVQQEFLNTFVQTLGKDAVIFNQKGRVKTTHNITFLFKGLEEIMHSNVLRGLKFDRIFFDICEETQRKYEKNLCDVLKVLYICLSSTGDIL